MGRSSALSLGPFALSMAADGLFRGQIRIHFSIIRLSSQPRLFFSAIALVLLIKIAEVFKFSVARRFMLKPT